MSKNAMDMIATVIQPVGATKYIGQIESTTSSSISMTYKKKRSSKYRRSSFPLAQVLAYGKDRKTGEDFIIVEGPTEVEDFRGPIEDVKGDFTIIATESGKVHIRSSSAKIDSADDFDGPGKKEKKSKKDKGEKKKKKKKK